jgi:hypothetical protein
VYAARRPQASQEGAGKERMHLNFQATQTYASRAGESFTHMHPNIRSCIKMHLRRGQATSQRNRLKAVYKRLEVREKKNR